MKKKLCIIFTGALLLALCASPGSASGLTGIEPPPIHFPLTLIIKNPPGSPTNATVGDTVTAVWTVTGGDPPYDKVTSNWVVDSSFDPSAEQVFLGGSPGDYTNTATFTKPVKAELWVSVLDGGETIDMYSGMVTVSEPLKAAFTLEQDAVGLGQSAGVGWEVTGGALPYQQVKTYWSLYSGGVYTPLLNEPGSATGSRSFAPTEGDRLALCVDVTDAAARNALFMSEWIDILHPVPILIEMSPLSKKAVTLGDIVMGGWSVTGGNLPYKYLTYQWRVFSGGTSLPTPSEYGAAEGYDSFWPKEGDQLALYVSVTDAGLYSKSKMTEKIPIIPVLRGDANQDGKIDILDLVAIIDYIVSDTFPTSFTNANADGDGTVDILDLVWVIDRIVGG